MDFPTKLLLNDLSKKKLIFNEYLFWVAKGQNIQHHMVKPQNVIG
jgi:hypothetical protein